MKRFYLLLVTALFAATCHSFAYDSLTIKGTLLGYDGKPMKMAHVHYSDVEYQTIDMFATDKNGRFEFKAEKYPHIYLSFTGTDHKKGSFAFYLSNDTRVINLDVKLSPNYIAYDVDSVKVLGNFNGFDWEEGLVNMTLGKDGIFTAEIPKTGDSLIYQIVGPFTKPQIRSVNGVSADFYMYDGGGDYRSVILNKDKKVKITFNPKNYPTTDFPFLIGSKNKDIQNYIDLSKKIDAISTNALEFLHNVRRVSTNKEFSNFFGKDLAKKSLDSIAMLLAVSKNDIEKQLILFSYLDIADLANRNNINDIYDKDIIEKIMLSFQTNDSIWIRKSWGLISIYDMLGTEKAESYVIDCFKKNKAELGILNIQSLKLLKNYKNSELVSQIFKDAKDTIQLISMTLTNANSKQLKDEKKFFYDMLVKDYPDSKTTKKAKFKYSESKGMQVGKMIPNFKVVSLDNPMDTITSKSLRGKYVLIDIWATWCGPCVGEMDNLHKAYEKFKDKNFIILSVSIDNKIDLPKKFRNGKWKMPWLNGFGESAWDSDIAVSFETTGIPRPVLIDPNGKILAMEIQLRGGMLDETLEKELKTNFQDTPLEVPLKKDE